MTKEELEKEVEKHKWNDIFLEDCTGYDKKIAEEYTTLQERIEELENKNKKLESDFRICEKNADTYYDQLTRAKEIIKELMSFSVQLCDCRHTVDFEKTREQAVQFLKEGE